MGASFSTHADTWQISNGIAVPCLQFCGRVTHTSAKRIQSFVLPRWGEESALLIVEADDRQGQLSRSFVLRARSPNCFKHWYAEVGIVGPLPLPPFPPSSVVFRTVLCDHILKISVRTPVIHRRYFVIVEVLILWLLKFFLYSLFLVYSTCLKIRVFVGDVINWGWTPYS